MTETAQKHAYSAIVEIDGALYLQIHPSIAKAARLRAFDVTDQKLTETGILLELAQVSKDKQR